MIRRGGPRRLRRGWVLVAGVLVAGVLVGGCGGATHHAHPAQPSAASVSKCLRAAGFRVRGAPGGATLVGERPPGLSRVLLVTASNASSATIIISSSTRAARDVAPLLGVNPQTLVVTAGRGDVVYPEPLAQPPPGDRRGIGRCALGTARRTYIRGRTRHKPAPPSVPAPGLPRAGTPAARRGRALIAQTGCLACHQIGRVGNNGPGPKLTDIGRRLNSQALKTALVTPRAPMPSFASLPTRQLRGLVAYLAGLSGHPARR